MNINPINNKESFFFKPLKIVQSLGWVAVAILALPTVVGPYFAWKKLAAIWSKNERSDTKKADEIASEVFLEDDEDGFVNLDSDKDYVEKTSQQKKLKLYTTAITQFQGSSCLGDRSAEAYLSYLKDTYPDFDFNMSLLKKGLKPSCNEFLKTIQAETAGKNSNFLFFVPFLLAGNSFREQHIVIAVVNMAKQQIEYFNPKGCRFYSMFGRDRNLAQWDMSTQEFLRNLSLSVFSNKEPSIIRNMNGPQSLFNRVDCGAHALDFIQTRILTNFIQSDPNYFETSLRSDSNQLRQEMAATLH